MASTATSHWIDKKSISCDKIHILLYCCPHQPLVGMTHHGQLMSCSSEAGASGKGSMAIEKKGRFLATSVDASMILVQGPPQLSLWKTVSYIILTGSNVLFLLSVLSYYFTFFLVTRISCLVDLESSLHFQLVSLRYMVNYRRIPWKVHNNGVAKRHPNLVAALGLIPGQ